MNLWWKCPNCGNKVEYIKEMEFVFDEEGEAEFNPRHGMSFHTILCECGASWITSIGEMEIMEHKIKENEDKMGLL